MPNDTHSPYDHAPPAPIGIRAALQALPLETPERDAWPLLAAHLPPAATPRWPWALAASVLLAVALVASVGQTPERGALAVQSSPDDELAPLLAESAQLEALLAAAANGNATSAPMVVLSTDLEDRLARIDGNLTGAAATDAQRLAWWRQRVDVLRELASLQSTQQWLAARGEQGYDGALVVAY